MNWQTVVAVLQALLTPIIAVLTVVIAVAQYRLAKTKLKPRGAAIRYFEWVAGEHFKDGKSR